MIAAIVRGGRSSSTKGALDYVLRLDPERVGETETVNLFSAPEHADKEMQATADAVKAIQARARAERGERPAASGSRAEKTCFHYALSWAHEDNPTAEHMFKAAHQTLERLGLSEHQAVIVQHTEKLHSHLHVVVSTVHPETGRTHGLYKDAHILNRWANEYELSQQAVRTFNRAAKFERENEWGKKEHAMTKESEKKQATQKPQWEVYKQRKQELWDKQQTEKTEIRKRQADRREALDDKIREIKRATALQKQQLREEHDTQLADYWRKDAPKMKLETRPGADMLRPVQSANAEIMQTLKAMERTAPHLDPTGRDRDDRDPANQVKAPRGPQQAQDTAEPSDVSRAFRDRTEKSTTNQLDVQDIHDRFDGEKAIKRWQRLQMEEIYERRDQAIKLVRDEYEQDKQLQKNEWQEHQEKFTQLRADLKQELSIPEKGWEKEAQTAAPEQKPMDVKSYVDDYIAGKGRDNTDYEQFAANHFQDIEREFQHRRAGAEQPEHDRYGNEIIDMRGPIAPEHAHEPEIPYSDAPPPTSMYPEPSQPEWHQEYPPYEGETSGYTRSKKDYEPEPEYDREMGD